MSTVFGYCRVSTMHQKLDRQIENVRSRYPDAVIISEKYTGTTVTDRPAFTKLCKALKAGDTVVFDSVSRMSRNAEEGFNTYMDLYNRGVNLIFLNEPMINTDVYSNSVSEGNGLPIVGNEIADVYIEATRKVFEIIARNQIRVAFNEAQTEVDNKRKWIKNGLESKRAKGETVGRVKGSTYETKKAKACKANILKMSADFNGSMSDKEVIEVLKIARNSYYKYKAELKEAQAAQ